MDPRIPPRLGAIGSVGESERAGARGAVKDPSGRFSRLLALRPASTSPPIPAALAVEGDWPAGCQAYPASFAQARLWFLHQLEPGLTTYHLPLLWRLQGRLDTTALAQALGSLVERHAPLRTSFRMEGATLLQIIHSPGPLPLEVQRLGDRQADEVWAAWLEQESRTPLDLTAGLLLRARLLVVAPEEHRLLINHHHIASDGWSCAVLARDLTELYNAHRGGRPVDLPPLTLRYCDHAARQRQRLSGAPLRELQDHWSSQLAGLEPLACPTDRPPLLQPSHEGARVAFAIEPTLLEPFEALCRSQGATLQAGLVALVGLLLHRISGQMDVGIGIPSWGRSDPASWRRADSHLTALIGCFVNTLPIRIRLQHGQTFLALLQQVKDTSLRACEHAELPFEQMVEALNLPRDTSRNPLVQVMLQLMELPEPSLQGLEGLEVERLDGRGNVSRFDLEFILRRHPGGGLNAQIIFATALFNADRIERLSSQLLTLLGSVVESPDAAVNALNLLPEAERLLIERWHQGPVVAVPKICMHELFEQQVQRTPEAIALVFGDQALSYGELNTRANRLAHALIDRGVGPEVIVALALERSVELVVALLAILKAGGAYLPLDPAQPLLRLGQILADAAPALVISSLRAVALIEATGVIVADALLAIPIGAEVSPDGDRIGSFAHLASPRSDAAANPGRRQDPATAAYLLYTSGTTGTPKGVLIEHRALVGRTTDLVGRLRLDPNAVVLAHTALSFDISIVEVLMPLTGGARVVLTTEEQQRDPAALIRLVKDHRITLLQATPSQWEVLLRMGYGEQPQILAIAGGEALPQPLAEAIRRQSGGLINGYGPTEVTIYASMQTVEADSAVGIGTPLAKTSALVLDREGRPCPIGIAGELFLGGCGVARGYRNRAELTRERFVGDPLSAERSGEDTAERLYATGDLAHWNPNGTLAYLGRIDQQIKLRGFRIEPGEIEAHLLAHPAVAQAAVVLRSDDPANPRLIAYWVVQSPGPSGAAAASADQLRAFLAERLPDYMVPAAFVELEALPLTTNGKLDRKALPAPSFLGDVQQRVQPSTDLERQLHALWAEVLGHGEFGISDNFFAIGGHSLAAARLVSRIEEKLGQRLPVASLFQSPTLASLASRLADGEILAHRRFRSLVTVQGQGEDPPLFVVHGGGGDVFIHVHLARCLAPRRPVFGLQAVGIDGSEPRHRTVEEMASHYASEIIRLRPQGPIHLLGYSGGGWYAWAVAAEILRRGGCLGLVGLVDTRGTADLHRRLRLQQLLFNGSQQLLQQLSQWRETPSLPRWNSLRRKLKALRFHGWTLLRTPGGMAPQALDPDAIPRPTQPLRGDYFLQLQTYYRPSRLPVRADIFSTPSAANDQRKLWNFYATGKAYLHPALLDHNDYYDADFIAAFAKRLDDLIRDIEAQEPRG